MHIYTWITKVFGRADKDFPVGDIANACWRITWFSDSELQSFSSSLIIQKWKKKMIKMYDDKKENSDREKHNYTCCHIGSKDGD